jgi:ABC-2 type transport system ATP-binding protein
VIAVESLTKRYGTTVAVDGLTFTAREGSILGFLGPNGAGKTTTLRIILGLAHPTSGNATIDGRPYRSLRDPTGMVGACSIHPAFTPAGGGGTICASSPAPPGCP